MQTNIIQDSIHNRSIHFCIVFTNRRHWYILKATKIMFLCFKLDQISPWFYISWKIIKLSSHSCNFGYKTYKPHLTAAVYHYSAYNTQSITETDKAIEDLIRIRVKKQYPDHGFIGEESVDVNGEIHFLFLGFISFHPGFISCLLGFNFCKQTVKYIFFIDDGLKC